MRGAKPKARAKMVWCVNSMVSRRAATRRAFALSEILQQMRPEHVYWVAMQPRQNAGEQNRVPRLSLHGAPIEIAQALRKTVFDAIRPVVLTSATLTTGQDFSFLRFAFGLGRRSDSIRASGRRD